MKAILYKAWLVLIFGIYTCEAQELLGTYRAIGQPTHIISFEKGVFKEEHGNDLTTKKGFGSYHLKKDKLIFIYRDYPQQDSSRYELIDQGPLAHSNLDIAIFDSQSVPMWGMYGCRDVENNILNLIGTDKNGKGNMTIFKNKNIGFFTIDRIGYHRILIPIKKIMGRSATLKAYLRPQENYYIEAGIKKYQILEFSSEKLVLTKDGTTYAFKKVE
ncbi:hypothetical protein [Pedobacter sp. SL55]|uniref:hypothetical protein n=1 Tax=Pedobacter sp. SL55 TaxID=2995161 RepID=UPI00227076DF|nr:hypothetical protein [Pedobacter sp. SL55]WAC41199.1 hypothetical protein OVA16_02150 [Pedobacter sp. SL55]